MDRVRVGLKVKQQRADRGISNMRQTGQIEF